MCQVNRLWQWIENSYKEDMMYWVLLLYFLWILMIVGLMRIVLYFTGLDRPIKVRNPVQKVGKIDQT
jgi:hypothetical protein